MYHEEFRRRPRGEVISIDIVSYRKVNWALETLVCLPCINWQITECIFYHALERLW